MNDNLIPEKLYYLRMLNDNLLKQDESQFTVKKVCISPAGVLEAERVWPNVTFTTKIFYNGEFYLTQFTDEEVEEFYDVANHMHDEDMDEDEE
jgi:hypothetical protein